jgi:glycosyltransferase involved in cell wall biosynthesis
MADPQLVLVAGKDPVTELDGHSSYVRAHALAAQRLGFLPHVVCVSRRTGVERDALGVVHRVRARGPTLRQVSVPWHAPGLVREVRGATRGTHDLILHGFGVWSYAAVVAARHVARPGRRVRALASAYTTYRHEEEGKARGIAAVHGRRARLALGVERLWVRAVLDRYEARGYLGADRVLVNYESVRRLLLARYPIADKVACIPYACDAAFRDETPRRETEAAPPLLAGLTPRGAPLVVSASRHDPRKGLDVLLRALARLRAEDVRFRACLLSGGRLLEAHRRLARELGLLDCVAITGWVPDPEPWLRHSDVFVLPSFEEGSGSVSLVEALRAGLAVVATRIDGIAEDVEHERSALLVPPGDPAALATALARLLRDAPLRAALRAAALRVHAERFSVEGFVRALGKIYASALG